MVFCNATPLGVVDYSQKVTILILIDGFLQYYESTLSQTIQFGHNPYFNRWFSAISTQKGAVWTEWSVTILILIDGFLQCRHSKLFRWKNEVTILILIDGFLQFFLPFNK